MAWEDLNQFLDPAGLRDDATLRHRALERRDSLVAKVAETRLQFPTRALLIVCLSCRKRYLCSLYSYFNS